MSFPSKYSEDIYVIEHPLLTFLENHEYSAEKIELLMEEAEIELNNNGFFNEIGKYFYFKTDFYFFELILLFLLILEKKGVKGDYIAEENVTNCINEFWEKGPKPNSPFDKSPFLIPTGSSGSATTLFPIR